METIQHAIATRLQGDGTLVALLPGGIWTRPIQRNDNGPDLPPTPGSTPDAFDEAGRIKRCLAVLNGQALADPSGALGTYNAVPELWLRCLPHASEKQLMEEAVARIIALLQGATVAVGTGAAVLTVAGRMMPVDDPELPPAVIDLIQINVASRW